MARIFVTVGTQGPFDRLIGTVDLWAGRTEGHEVFAQIGSSRSRPAHIEWAATLHPAEFDRHLRTADVVVAHAGMGTIIKALEMGKPVVVFPRRSSLGEQRNDHQLATARRLDRLGLVRAAFDPDELIDRLDDLKTGAVPGFDPAPSASLVEAVRSVIDEAAGGGTPRVLAAASAGGHWNQLLKLTTALGLSEIVYVTVDRSLRADVPEATFLTVSDANRRTPVALVRSALEAMGVVARRRPHVVISTGAAPGYLVARAAHLLGSRTIWVDSLANVDELSRSGQLAGRFSDLWLTQWPELARAGGPRYAGAVVQTGSGRG